MLYQLRQTAQIIRSVVNTKALQLEQTQAQYIYIDDPRFKGKRRKCPSGQFCGFFMLYLVHIFIYMRIGDKKKL